MTEIPEHLLARSRQRRAALGGGGDGGGESAPAAAEPAGGGAVESAAAAATPARSAEAATPAVPSAPAEPEYTGPPPPPPRKARVPIWAMPVVAALPLWAFFYSGAFGERAVEQTGPLALGSTIYRSAGCGGCHGPTGGGGVGPAMDLVNQTFPAFEDHLNWIKTGSQPFAGQPYGAQGKVATGGMPGFEGSLTEEEIIAVTCYERVTFGGAEPPPECAAEGAAGAEGGGGGGGDH